MLSTEVTKRLKIKYPIIQAPMAGGITTSQLVAAVSNSGGLGMIGAGYLTPAQLREQIREVKELTLNHFGVNVFVPGEFTISQNGIDFANEKLQSIKNHLNIADDSFQLPDARKLMETFHEHMEIVIEEKVPVCSFTFGIPSKEVISRLKEHQMILIGTATTVREALENQENGMDMVVVQGSEAGGHRGNFSNSHQESLIGLMSLIPQAVDCVRIPVIAAGGIMDGRGVMAAICLGAKAVQMGTAFLTCQESGAHRLHKEAILQSDEDQVILTRAFSGKWARGINNQFISTMHENEASFPAFPVQNTLTQSIRKTAAAQNNPDYMSLWSGQSPRLAKSLTAEELIQDIMLQVKNIIFD
ncbi:NAD(P)H-dependent flavin oxidoreductase [Niallia endozanthoxylica]|uniref:Probable nitronate monooxygenase n=1 Tax=Niallia endozanthoxylica TaxID=2036016 RepID=A0A5J5I1U5_9BACI|nr:nitronate monooxygenase [Niallia endozanthoxylica]KAA9028530.1 nitronate monooxygenase [Niallia endozanthoxylica]